MLYGLESIQDQSQDPTAASIQCQKLFVTTHICKVKIASAEWCYVCSGGDCTPSHC